MIAQQKACPIVVRGTRAFREVLAFQHPSAGRQFVKGTIEPGEAPSQAAERELLEESGLSLPSPLVFAGKHEIDMERQLWHFFYAEVSGLPDSWDHQATDDNGHVFQFFWHPLHAPLDDAWHSLFHEVFGIIRTVATSPS
jgi:8-oxo-dGTP pyrophosphatase MutT (NUDIX family)